MEPLSPFNLLKTLPKQTILISLTVIVSALASPARASTFTRTSPTEGGSLVPSTMSEVGGIVLDLIGANGTRVVSQMSAAQLFQGNTFGKTNPVTTIGTQTGFNTSLLNALGGGLREAAVRLTLFDGDTAANNFDFKDNSLLANGVNFGNWSSVNAQNTDGAGNVAVRGMSSGGFRNDVLDTGWFHVTDGGILSSFFNTLSSGVITYALLDRDPGDQFLDFRQGVAANQLNISQAPTMIPSSSASVPEPSSLFGLLTLGVLSSVIQKRKQERNAPAKVEL